jgi:hypothetical protein
MTDLHEPKMTAAECAELKTLVNEYARLEIQRVRALGADRLAELNAQIEANLKAEVSGVAELVGEMQAMAAEADAKIRTRAEELGIHPELRPNAGDFFRRPAVPPWRRDQLRQLAKDKIEATIRQAETKINSWKVDTRTELLAAGLTLTAARTFLDALPTAADLLPTIAVSHLDEALDSLPAGDWVPEPGQYIGIDPERLAPERLA